MSTRPPLHRNKPVHNPDPCWTCPDDDDQIEWLYWIISLSDAYYYNKAEFIEYFDYLGITTHGSWKTNPHHAVIITSPNGLSCSLYQCLNNWRTELADRNCPFMIKCIQNINGGGKADYEGFSTFRIHKTQYLFVAMEKDVPSEVLPSRTLRMGGRYKYGYVVHSQKDHTLIIYQPRIHEHDSKTVFALDPITHESRVELCIHTNQVITTPEHTHLYDTISNLQKLFTFLKSHDQHSGTLFLMMPIQQNGENHSCLWTINRTVSTIRTAFSLPSIGINATTLIFTCQPSGFTKTILESCGIAEGHNQDHLMNYVVVDNEKSVVYEPYSFMNYWDGGEIPYDLHQLRYIFWNTYEQGCSTCQFGVYDAQNNVQIECGNEWFFDSASP